MNTPELLSQQQSPKHRVPSWLYLGVSLLSLLARFWRLFKWIGTILIAGADAGILGHVAYVYITTGELTFSDPGTLTLVSWLNTHLALWVPVLLFLIELLFCSFLAHKRQQHQTQSSHQEQPESLVILAKGVQRTLDELKANPVLSQPPAALRKGGQEETPPPEKIWTIPYRRNPIFTGREDLLQQLYEHLHTSRAATVTQPQAMSGLGGIGKTQLAIEYAYRHRDEYRAVLWVNAASRDTVISGFLDLADRLQLPEREEQDQDCVVAAIKSWCATNESWLLIFDNADNLPLVEDFLPPDGRGHLLLTTRDQAPETLAHALEVAPLDLEHGMVLLLRRANVLQPGQALEQASAADRQAAEAIVRAMNGLPLALEQAGAYIEETQCSLASCRDQFQQRQARLLQWRSGTESKRYPHSVVTTWALSFEQVETLDPLAAELLRFCAFLAPDAIPEWLIIDGASALGPSFQPLLEKRATLDKAIATLGRYSLLKRGRDEQTLCVHRLVQAVLKQSLDERTQRKWAERTIKAVNQAFPDVSDYHSWPRCQELLPHAQACFAHLERWHFASAEAGTLCNQVGYYLDDRAQYPEAAAWYQRAIAIGEQVFGPEHPNLATDLNNLATLYVNQGEYEQAEPFYQRAIAIDEQVLGSAHPYLATRLNNLANLYFKQGKYEQGAPLYQRAIAIDEKVLGPEHPALATDLNNLANLYSGQGKYEQAAPLYQRAIAIDEQVLGSAHPSTIRLKKNYQAFLHQRQSHSST